MCYLIKNISTQDMWLGDCQISPEGTIPADGQTRAELCAKYGPECLELTQGEQEIAPLIDSEPRLFCDTQSDGTIVYFWQVPQFDINTGDFLGIQFIGPAGAGYSPTGTVSLCPEGTSHHVEMCLQDGSGTKYHQCVVKTSQGLVSKTYFTYITWELVTLTEAQEALLIPCKDICSGYVNGEFGVGDGDYSVSNARCVLIKHNISQSDVDEHGPITVTLSGANITGNGIIRVRPGCDKKIELSCGVVEQVSISGITSGDVDIEVYN